MEEGRGVSPEGRDGTRVEAGAGPQVEEKEDCPGTPRASISTLMGWNRTGAEAGAKAICPA